MESVELSNGNGCNGFSKNHEEENALDRVVNLPVVVSTWNAMHNYYTSVKMRYPTVTPYLEAAENLTTTAANIAMTKSKPVVDKLGPTVNTYANKGLDTLEDRVPIITKDPEEIYSSTKSKAADLLTNKMNSALDVTEKYVDYYLPSDEEDNEMNDVSISDSDDEDDDDVSETSSKSDETIDEETANPKERLRYISNKVRQRSYQKAMKKWTGVQVRSREALSKLHFTVDLIQYAQTAFDSPNSVVTSANEKMMNGMSATLDGLHLAANTVNQQVEDRILKKARRLTQQLNTSCQTALKYVQNSPRLHPLLEQAIKAKEATEDLYSAFADKTSISQISNVVIESTRPKIQFVEKTLLQILEALSEQPPVSWLAPDLDLDPLGGMDMSEIEEQLYGAQRFRIHGLPFAFVRCIMLDIICTFLISHPLLFALTSRLKVIAACMNLQAC